MRTRPLRTSNLLQAAVTCLACAFGPGYQTKNAQMGGLSFPPEVQPPPMIGEIWMRSMPANMILLLDAASTFLVTYYARERMISADVLHGHIPLDPMVSVW